MKSITVTIRGFASLLIHRFGEAAEAEAKTRTVNIERESPREQAAKAAYSIGGHYFFPGAAVARLLREAGGGHKQRGSRKSLKFIVPAAVTVDDDMIKILDLAGQPVTDFEVDSRPVTIPATKGRIMRHRPRFDAWTATFTLTVDEEVLDADVVQTLLVDGGRRLGIGDFRPEKGGPFGRFHIASWQSAELPEPQLAAAAE